MGLTNAAFKVKPVYQSKAENSIPKSIAFVPPIDPNPRQEHSEQPGVGEYTSDLLIFSYVNGSISRLDCEGNCIHQMNDGPGTMRASVCMMQCGTKFLADTGGDFELFDLAEGRKRVKSFSVGARNRLLPKHAAFTKSDTVLVCGTDEGHAAVFDVSAASVVQRLEGPYPNVQHIAVHANATDDLVAIAAGSVKDTSQNSGMAGDFFGTEDAAVIECTQAGSCSAPSVWNEVLSTARKLPVWAAR
ncbi:hypothetical protein EV121DRAFT_274766 [Schizophyllum commune]